MMDIAIEEAQAMYRREREIFRKDVESVLNYLSGFSASLEAAIGEISRYQAMDALREAAMRRLVATEPRFPRKAGDAL